MTTKSLSGSSLQFIYSIFFVENDSDLCTRMADIGLIYTLVVGLYSIFLPAPYGRYKSNAFGPAINARLGWIIQECMSFFSPIILISATPSLMLQNFPNALALFLFLSHYFQRSFLYPLVTSSSSKPVPIITMWSAIVFTTYNGVLQGMSLTNVIKVDDSFYGFLGTILFVIGMAINVTHDRMLIALRKGNEEQTDVGGENSAKRMYKIPKGGLFEYVSAANYLGEIIEWIGLAIVTRCYHQLVFALFSAVFLGIRGIHHHNFYKKTFGADYPESRKAIIPYIL